MTNPKSLLIVSYHFPPSPIANPYPTSSWAKYLLEYGWLPVVLTNNLGARSTTEKVPYPIYSVSYKDSFDWLQKLRKKYRNNSIHFKVLNFLLINFLLYPDDICGWYNVAVSNGFKIIRKHDIKLILSVGSPWTDHKVSNKLSLITGIPWIADYRDPWTQPSSQGIRPKWIFQTAISRILQRKTIRSAACCIHASSVWATTLKRMLGKPVYVIPNGYDSDEFENKEFLSPPNSIFTISYVGTLHFLQRPEVFIEAFSRFIVEMSISPEKCRLQFIGSNQLDIINDYPLMHDYCSFIPYTNKSIAIKYMMTSHILLLFLSKDTGWYPTKVFEYLASGNKILATPDNGGVINKLLNETSAGVVLNTAKEISEWLKEQYILFQEKGEIYPNTNKSVVENYAREKLTAKLVDILKGVQGG